MADRLGDRIRYLLKVADRPMSELTAYVGVSAQAGYQWMNNESLPRGKRKDAIARFFGISTQQLDYAPLVSISPLTHQVKALTGSIDAAIREHGIQQVILAELSGILKSYEYKQGMAECLLSNIEQRESAQPYDAGTCQFDAFEAGLNHGRIVIEQRLRSS